MGGLIRSICCCRRFLCVFSDCRMKKPKGKAQLRRAKDTQMSLAKTQRRKALEIHFSCWRATLQRLSQNWREMLRHFRIASAHRGNDGALLSNGPLNLLGDIVLKQPLRRCPAAHLNRQPRCLRRLPVDRWLCVPTFRLVCPFQS